MLFSSKLIISSFLLVSLSLSGVAKALPQDVSDTAPEVIASVQRYDPNDIDAAVAKLRAKSNIMRAFKHELNLANAAIGTCDNREFEMHFNNAWDLYNIPWKVWIKFAGEALKKGCMSLYNSLRDQAPKNGPPAYGDAWMAFAIETCDMKLYAKLAKSARRIFEEDRGLCRLAMRKCPKILEAYESRNGQCYFEEFE